MKWFALKGIETGIGMPGSDSTEKLHDVRVMDETPTDMKPLRWVAHLPLAILPFLAATFLEGPRLARQLEQRVTASLAEQNQGWAKVLVQGRDVEIRGLAPAQAAADAVLDEAKATWGVRSVAMRVGVQQ